jgi:glucose/mannose-6-phosphate isomerase
VTVPAGTRDPVFERLIARLPEQSRLAWELGNSCALPATEATRERAGSSWPHRVFVVGMGASAIGADIVATIAARHTSIPVAVVRDYELPPLDSDTLVLLSSFSGNTEETLEAAEETARAGAAGIAITTGGRLPPFAEEHGLDLVTYTWDRPPRTALGFGVYVPLAILERLGVFALPGEDIEASFAAVEAVTTRSVPDAAENDARELAAWLNGGVPAILGPGFLEVAARRWAGEIGENSKLVAAWYGMPEFNHNLFEPAAIPGNDIGPLRFLILDAAPVYGRNRVRLEHTAAMLRDAGREVRVVDAGGDSPLAAIMASCALGTWTSYYLALLRGVDAASVEMMEHLKVRLAEAE